jgi:hypothetical protein
VGVDDAVGAVLEVKEGANDASCAARFFVAGLFTACISFVGAALKIYRVYHN